jgi:hypothetical protein
MVINKPNWFLVNGDQPAGTRDLTVDTGTGDASGRKFKIGVAEDIYTVTLATKFKWSIKPALKTDVKDNSVITIL